MSKKTNFASGEGKVEISLDGGTTWAELKDVTNFGISVDTSDETWTPFSGGGFQKAYATSKSLSVSVEKNLNASEVVDQEILSLAFVSDVSNHNFATVKFEFPLIDDTNTTPATLEITGPIIIGDVVSGASTDMSMLNFEIHSNGKPVYAQEAA